MAGEVTEGHVNGYPWGEVLRSMRAREYYGQVLERIGSHVSPVDGKEYVWMRISAPSASGSEFPVPSSEFEERGWKK